MSDCMVKDVRSNNHADELIHNIGHTESLTNRL